jgi:hypothetical protein
MHTGFLKGLAFTFAIAMLAGCSSSTPPTVAPTPAILPQLATLTTIGSTIDATNGDANPYGLAIAPITAGALTAGDLVICNFNDGKGNGGAGTTIEDLKPVAGSKPVRIAQDPSLAGCSALAFSPAGNIWAAAYTANDNPIFKPTGVLSTTLATNFVWQQPWGQIFASPTAPAGSTTASPQAFFISDAADGSMVQANITPAGPVFNQVISGFPHAVDPKYGILAPAGLTYDPATDTLYVVSSETNSILAFSSVSTIPANGITISFNAMGPQAATASSFSFTGPSASKAKVLFTGTPLNYPVSSALLANGDLIVGNTGDNNMVEIRPSTGTSVATKMVDTGGPGAIFGIVTTGTTAATQKISFNDDNTNSVVQIGQ